MSITPKPIAFSDEIDKSRDVLNFGKWGQSSRTVSFIMFMLGLFTIPVEVMLRKDFGQRWFTAVNFYAGFFLLLMFAMLQYLVAALSGFISWVASAINPFHTAREQAAADSIMDKSMFFVLLAYVVLGSYHSFKIWWRDRTDNALHSFDDGTSRTTPVAKYLIWLLNYLAVPLVWLYTRLIPKGQREDEEVPDLIENDAAFINTVVEPFLLLALAYWFHGIVSLWLFISAIALAIHANWKETAKRNKSLDFRDSKIDAEAMMELREKQNRKSTRTRRLAQENTRGQVQNPIPISKPKPPVSVKYPDLMNIIEEMNRDGSHLAN